MFPGLSEGSTSRSTPYDSQILRFRSTPTPDSIRERILACVRHTFGANNTPTSGLSNAELLYGHEGVASRTSHANGDDVGGSADYSGGGGGGGGYDRERQRYRDMDVGVSNGINGSNSNHHQGSNSNKRPSSRNRQQRATCAVVDKVSFDRDRDEGRAMTNSLPLKPSNFRSNGLRSTLIRGEQLLAQRGGNVPNSGRDSDDLIAMGTLWNPAANSTNGNAAVVGGSSGINTRSSSNTTASNKSATTSTTNTNNLSGSSTNGSRKPVTVSINSSMRLQHSSSTGNLPYNGNGGIMGRHSGGNGSGNNNNNNAKEVEPKYPDPIMGATASFQQRLMELAALEAETIRWERTKRVKKKPRPDRD